MSVDVALAPVTRYQAGNWEFSENAGYYVHRSRVYLQGEIGAFGQGGITAEILTGLPAAIRPASAQSFTLYADNNGTDDAIDPALLLPLSYAATLTPDGSLSLDAPPPDSINTPPPGTYTAIDIGTGLPATYPRYTSTFDLTIALANVSWAIATEADSFSPVSFGPYLGPDFTDIDSTVRHHDVRVHLNGHVRANADGAYRLAAHLPDDLKAAGPDDNGDYGVIVAHDPRHWRVGALIGGDSISFSNDPVPSTPPGVGGAWGTLLEYPGLSDGLVGGHPIFQVGLTVQNGDDSFGGGADYSCPIYNSFCEVTDTILCTTLLDGSGGPTGPFSGGASGSVAALVANYDPPPDWIALRASVEGSAIGGVAGCRPCYDELGHFDGGGCLGSSASVQVVVSAPGPLLDDSGNPADSSVLVGGVGTGGDAVARIDGPWVARPALAYTDAPDDPRSILLWRPDEVGLIGFNWSGIGSHGGADWSLGIYPFWERRKVYFKAGDVLDLTGAGWQTAFIALIVGSMVGGPGRAGEIRHGRVHGRTGAGTVTAPPAQGHYSIAGLVQLAESVGLRGESAATAGAVAMAESGGDPSNIGYNPGPPESFDRGLWQINNYYHPEVSDACAFAPDCNAQAMRSISSNGTNWTPWATYNNGLHLPYMDAARAAVAQIESGDVTAATAGAGRRGQLTVTPG